MQANEKVVTVKRSIFKVVLWAIGIVFVIWMVLGSFPTGWIYDLAAGTGTAPGAKPDATVAQLTGLSLLDNQNNWRDTPFTVTSDTFVFCPLAKLRDPDEQGIHRTGRRAGNKTVNVKMYAHLRTPMTFSTKLFYSMGMSASYNNYYLVQLADGNYICAFFDNYHILGNWGGRELQLPSGTIRYADTDEKKMLNLVSKDYSVSTEYVLDLYNHDKSSWMLDKLLRIVLALVAIGLVLSLKGLIVKRKK